MGRFFFKKAVLVLALTALLLGAPITAKKAQACCVCYCGGGCSVAGIFYGAMEAAMEAVFEALMSVFTSFFVDNEKAAIAASFSAMASNIVVAESLDAGARVASIGAAQGDKRARETAKSAAVELARYDVGHSTELAAIVSAKLPSGTAQLAARDMKADAGLAGHRTMAGVRDAGCAADQMPNTCNDNRRQELAQEFCDKERFGAACGNEEVKNTDLDVDFARLTGRSIPDDLLGAVEAMRFNIYDCTIPPETLPTAATGALKKLNYFSYAAKCAIATHTFDRQMAGHRSNPAITKEALEEVLADFGLDANVISTFEIEQNPSFDQVAEVLSRAIVLRQDFVADGMQGEAQMFQNEAILQSLQLQQRRDLFEAMLGSELATAVMYDTELYDDAINVNAGMSQNVRGTIRRGTGPE